MCQNKHKFAALTIRPISSTHFSCLHEVDKCYALNWFVIGMRKLPRWEEGVALIVNKC